MIANLAPGELVIVGAVVLLAASAQMVSGFGFALLAVPLMGLVVDLKTAVVVSTLCGAGSNTYQAIADRAHRLGRLALVLVCSSFAGMPFGLILLDRVDVDSLRVIVGLTVLLVLLAMMRKNPVSKTEGMSSSIIAGFLSGLLATSTSTNGPPLVLLLRSRGLTPDQFRATINTVFSIVALLSIGLFIVAGKFTQDVASGAAVGLPGLIAGTAAGARMRGALSPAVFWKVVAVLLVMAGTSSIVSGLF